jgi:hypothetical protein
MKKAELAVPALTAALEIGIDRGALKASGSYLEYLTAKRALGQG